MLQINSETLARMIAKLPEVAALVRRESDEKFASQKVARLDCLKRLEAARAAESQATALQDKALKEIGAARQAVEDLLKKHAPTFNDAAEATQQTSRFFRELMTEHGESKIYLIDIELQTRLARFKKHKADFDGFKRAFGSKPPPQNITPSLPDVIDSIDATEKALSEVNSLRESTLGPVEIELRIQNIYNRLGLTKKQAEPEAFTA